MAKLDNPDYLLESEHAIAKAAEKNLAVVFPRENELFLDFDSKEHVAAFFEQFNRLTGFVPILKLTMTPSETPDHYHAVLKLTISVTDTERILLQACLGSDRTRELLSFARVLKKDPHPTLFLEKPETVEEQKKEEPPEADCPY